LAGARFAPPNARAALFFCLRLWHGPLAGSGFDGCDKNVNQPDRKIVYRNRKKRYNG
jgi:hypothetical protein